MGYFVLILSGMLVIYQEKKKKQENWNLWVSFYQDLFPLTIEVILTKILSHFEVN